MPYKPVRTTLTLAYRIRTNTVIRNTTLYGLDLRNFVDSAPVDNTIIEGSSNEHEEEIEES